MTASIDGSASTAFLVVAARPGREVPDHVQDLLRSQYAPGLPFASSLHRHWSNSRGLLQLGVWDAPPTKDDGRFVATPTGCAVVVGHYRASGDAWRTGTAVTQAFVEQHDVVRAGNRTATDGAYAAARLTEDHGVVMADPMGFAFLFAATTEDIVVFGTRAELVAWASTPPGAAPSKDALAGCWLVLSPYAIGSRTGFTGVELLAEGTDIHLQPDQDPKYVRRPAPWLDGVGEDDLSPDELLEIIDQSIADGVQASLALPVEQRFIDLTGGKDSRLLLAVAVGHGLADEFIVQTAGPDDLRDVEIARGITSMLGLPHRTGLLWPIESRPYEEQVSSFVAATTGTVNLWDLKLPRQVAAELRVSGMTGECLRAHVPLPRRPTSGDELFEIVRRKFLGRTLPLLRPDTQGVLDAELRAAILDPDITCDDPLDRLGTFMIRNRARRPRGSMDELESDFRVWPLASPRAVRAAYALGADKRQAEYVHRRLTERHSSALAAYPFAGPGWNSPVAPRQPPRVAGPQAPQAKPKKGEAILERGHRQFRDTRRQLLDEVLADAGNSVWDLIDRDVALSALAELDSLSMRQLRQLCAVATNAIWLTD